MTLYNVRNFEWRDSDSDYTQLLGTRHYDLERMSSLDMHHVVLDLARQ